MDAGTAYSAGVQVRPSQTRRMAAISQVSGGAAGAVAAGMAAQHAELAKHARRLVGQTFFGPMLRQMRNSPFKSELFSGGRGGDAFASLLDQHMVERMAARSGRGLAESIANRIEARKPGPRVRGPAPLGLRTQSLAPQSAEGV